MGDTLSANRAYCAMIEAAFFPDEPRKEVFRDAFRFGVDFYELTNATDSRRDLLGRHGRTIGQRFGIDRCLGCRVDAFRPAKELHKCKCRYRYMQTTHTVDSALYPALGM